MSKSSLKLLAYKKSKEKGDIREDEDKTWRCSDQIEYALGRTIRKLEKTLSRRRMLPFVEENGKSYDSYIFNFVNFVEEKGYLIEELYSEEYESVFRAVKSFRVLLSNSNKPPINEVIELGVLPKFVDCLRSKELMLQYEAAWLITNITYCSSVQTRFVIESGAVDALVRLLWTDCDTVQTQAAWALGNIAGDEDAFRDHVIRKGAVPGVVHVMKVVDSEKMLTTCAWVLENLCSGCKDFGRMVQVLPVLRELLPHENQELVCKCLRVLTHLSADKNMAKEIINCDGLFYNVTELLRGDEDIICYVLQVIANLADSTGSYVIENILNPIVLDKLSLLFQTDDIFIRRLVCQVVENLTFTHEEHIAKILTSDVFQMLLDNVRGEEDVKIQKHTVAVVENVLSLGTSEQINTLFQVGIIEILCRLLEVPNECVLQSVLQCVERVLEVGEDSSGGGVNDIAVNVEDSGGLQLLEYLLSHESEGIYRKAFQLMEKYFNYQEEYKGDDLEDVYLEYLPKEHVGCCS